LTGIIKNIKWRKTILPAGATVSSTILKIGYYGKGDPKVALVAGVHGDEGPWGAWAVQKLLERTKADQLKGSLKIVPQANPLAMEVDSRVAPVDHLDLNRVFPGDENGSYTERLACFISREVLDDADLVIDLHGGGSWCVNAFAFKFKGSDKFAKAFDPPFLLDAPKREGTITGYAYEKGSNVVAVEMGGKCHMENVWAEYISEGIERCLKHIGVIDGGLIDFKCKSVQVGPSKVLRPSLGGMFIPGVDASKVGTIVEKGTILGRIVDPASMEVREVFKAPFKSTAILLLRPMITVLNGGEMTYVVSSPLNSGDS
jgi:predicted deacylase